MASSAAPQRVRRPSDMQAISNPTLPSVSNPILVATQTARRNNAPPPRDAPYQSQQQQQGQQPGQGQQQQQQLPHDRRSSPPPPAQMPTPPAQESETRLLNNNQAQGQQPEGSFPRPVNRRPPPPFLSPGSPAEPGEWTDFVDVVGARNNNPSYDSGGLAPSAMSYDGGYDSQSYDSQSHEDEEDSSFEEVNSAPPSSARSSTFDDVTNISPNLNNLNNNLLLNNTLNNAANIPAPISPADSLRRKQTRNEKSSPVAGPREKASPVNVNMAAQPAVPSGPREKNPIVEARRKSSPIGVPRKGSPVPRVGSPLARVGSPLGKRDSREKRSSLNSNQSAAGGGLGGGGGIPPGSSLGLQQHGPLPPPIPDRHPTLARNTQSPPQGGDDDYAYDQRGSRAGSGAPSPTHNRNAYDQNHTPSPTHTGRGLRGDRSFPLTEEPDREEDVHSTPITQITNQLSSSTNSLMNTLPQPVNPIPPSQRVPNFAASISGTSSSNYQNSNAPTSAYPASSVSSNFGPSSASSTNFVPSASSTNFPPSSASSTNFIPSASSTNFIPSASSTNFNPSSSSYPNSAISGPFSGPSAPSITASTPSLIPDNLSLHEDDGGDDDGIPGGGSESEIYTPRSPPVSLPHHAPPPPMRNNTVTGGQPFQQHQQHQQQQQQHTMPQPLRTNTVPINTRPPNQQFDPDQFRSILETLQQNPQAQISRGGSGGERERDRNFSVAAQQSYSPTRHGHAGGGQQAYSPPSGVRSAGYSPTREPPQPQPSVLQHPQTFQQQHPQQQQQQQQQQQNFQQQQQQVQQQQVQQQQVQQQTQTQPASRAAMDQRIQAEALARIQQQQQQAQQAQRQQEQQQQAQRQQEQQQQQSAPHNDAARIQAYQYAQQRVAVDPRSTYRQQQVVQQVMDNNRPAPTQTYTDPRLQQAYLLGRAAAGLVHRPLSAAESIESRLDRFDGHFASMGAAAAGVMGNGNAGGINGNASVTGNAGVGGGASGGINGGAGAGGSGGRVEARFVEVRQGDIRNLPSVPSASSLSSMSTSSSASQQQQQLQQQLQQQIQQQQQLQQQQSHVNRAAVTGSNGNGAQDRYASTGTNEGFDTGNDTAVDPELRYLQHEMNMFNPYSPQNARGQRDFYQNGGRGGEDYGISPPPSTFNPMSPADNNGQMFNPLSPGSNFDPPTPYDMMSPPGSHTRPGAPIPPGTTAPVTPVDGGGYIPQTGSGVQTQATAIRAPQATAPIHEQLLTPASNERVQQQQQQQHHLPDHYRSGLLTHNGGGYAGNAYGRNGMPLAPPSESSYSVSSTPYPGNQYNPFLFRQANHISSMHSSPSHLPLDLEMPMPMRRSGARGRAARVGGGNSGARRLSQLQHQSWPPRGESTIPADTDYDETPSQSEGEEEYEGGILGLGKRARQSKEEQELRELLAAGNDAMRQAEYLQMHAEEEDVDEWVDEADSDEDLEHELDLWDPTRSEEERSHPKFIKDEEKRRRKWEVKFGELVKLFHELDRLTDTPMVLLAVPPHAPHAAVRRRPHIALSHSIRRDPGFTAQAHAARSSYSTIVSRLDAIRQVRSPPKPSSRGPSHSSHSSPSNADSSVTSEEQLRKTLMSALGSLKMLGKVYDKREQRRMEESSKQKEERDSIEKVLNMVLMGVAGSTIGKGTINEPHLRSPGLGGSRGLSGSGNTSGTGTTVTPSAPTPDNDGSTTPT